MKSVSVKALIIIAVELVLSSHATIISILSVKIRRRLELNCCRRWWLHHTFLLSLLLLRHCSMECIHSTIWWIRLLLLLLANCGSCGAHPIRNTKARSCLSLIH